MAVAWALSLAVHGQAQDRSERGPYFNVGAGPAWTDKVTVKEILVPVTGVSAKFDTGFRFDVSGGYRFNKWLAGELETGVAYNSIKTVGVTPIDGSVANIPFTANIVFRYPNNSKWEPYIGGGGGVALSVLTLNNAALPGGVTLDGSASDAVFAYQGFAGLRYHLNDRMSLGAYYKLLGTGDTSWDVSGAAGRIRSEGLVTHSVGVAFTFRF
jgi:opacity protein-like surface antigen